MTAFDLHCGDALSIMSGLPPASIDAVICDPPYGTTRNAWDAVIAFDDMWAQLRRIVKPGGAMVFTASQPFSSALVMSNPHQFRHEWIWHKNKASGHLNARRAPMKAHEAVLVFCDGAPMYRPQMTTGHAPTNAYYTSHTGRNYGPGRVVSGGGATERCPRSVQSFDVVNNDDPTKVHPTQKPLALMEYLVRTYVAPGMLVLDFAMGSGTTGEACVRNACRFIGIDNDADMVAYAYRRIGAMSTCN